MPVGPFVNRNDAKPSAAWIFLIFAVMSVIIDLAALVA
jgi:hypothetical protein